MKNRDGSRLALVASITALFSMTLAGAAPAQGIHRLTRIRPFDDAPRATYPLHVSTNGRYLVGRNNVPFLLMGDSPQAMIANLSEIEAGAFLADREANGFNAVWVNLLCATYTGGRADGSTFDGILPFTVAPQMLLHRYISSTGSTPNTCRPEAITRATERTKARRARVSSGSPPTRKRNVASSLPLVHKR